MSRVLRLHPAALRELNEAADYYDAEGPGLGTAFIDELERALGQIRAFPQACPPVAGPVRRKIVVAFPYAVIYSVLDDTVTVLAVAHQHRRPFYWRDRQ
jgi:plasmid stabilization system protein ParE